MLGEHLPELGSTDRWSPGAGPAMLNKGEGERVAAGESSHAQV